MNEIEEGRWRTIQDMREQSKYSARSQATKKLGYRTSRMLTILVIESKRRKDEIKAFLQQL